MRYDELSWLSWTLHQLSGKYAKDNVLRASENAWNSLSLPLNGVIVPFLQQGGQLPHNDPGALTLERLVSCLRLGRGSENEHATYETAVAALFSALRAAHNTLVPVSYTHLTLPTIYSV